jgi:hypothetical protein
MSFKRSVFADEHGISEIDRDDQMHLLDQRGLTVDVKEAKARAGR